MALGGFKDNENVMNPKGHVKDLRIFNDEIGIGRKYAFK
jgi:hypothetical protein